MSHENSANSASLDWDMLDRYLAGECSQAERVVVEGALARDPEKANLLMNFVERAAGERAPKVDSARVLSEWQSKIVTNQPGSATNVFGKTFGWVDKVAETFRNDSGREGVYSRWSLRWWVGYVAFAVAVFAINYTSSINPKPLPDTQKIYTTAPGQRASITLVDGSKVILAPATTMRSYGSGGRNIELLGEAVFTVSQNLDSPFTVKTKNTITRVLGTTFGVKAYEDNQVRVAVSHGRVATGNDAILAGNDVAVIHGNTTTITHDVDVAALLSWTSGTLTFNKALVSQILTDAGRWYGLQIKADKQTLNRIVTVTFTNETQEQMLETLSSLLEVSVSREGNTIYMTRKSN